jgi:hypothetical protein
MIKLTSLQTGGVSIVPGIAGDEIVAASDALEPAGMPEPATSHPAGSGMPEPAGRDVRAASRVTELEQAEVARPGERGVSSRSVRRRRWRPIAVGVAGTIVTLASGGCGGVSSSASASYWLIKASGSYGTIYGYPPGDRAAPSVHAQYLGPTAADAHANAQSAAKRLGVKHLDPGIY